MTKIKFEPKGFFPGAEGDDKHFNNLSFHIGEINPKYSYYAGDIATLDIFETCSDVNNFFPKGYIYPCPILINQSEGEEKLTLSNSKLGVFLYFEYTPIGKKTSIRTECFIAGTPVEPGTKIKTFVIISNKNRWYGLLKTHSYSDSGIKFTDPYRPMQVCCDETYLVNFPHLSSTGTKLLSEVYFPKGSDHIIHGRSRSYLKEISDESVIHSIKPKDFTSVFLLTPEKSNKTGITHNPHVYFSFANSI